MTASVCRSIPALCLQNGPTAGNWWVWSFDVFQAWLLKNCLALVLGLLFPPLCIRWAALGFSLFSPWLFRACLHLFTSVLDVLCICNLEAWAHLTAYRVVLVNLGRPVRAAVADWFISVGILLFYLFTYFYNTFLNVFHFLLFFFQPVRSSTHRIVYLNSFYFAKMMAVNLAVPPKFEAILISKERNVSKEKHL